MVMKRSIGFSKIVVLSLILAFGVLVLASGPAIAAAKDTIVVSQGSDPSTLDPQRHRENPAWIIINNIFDFPYMRFFEGGTIVMKPALAESHKVISPTEWEFKLRKGVKFHNGEPFTAESFKYTLDRFLDPKIKSQRYSNYKPLKEVKIIDDHTVRVITHKPYPVLLNTFSFSAAMLAPKYYREKSLAYLATHPIGTGPYKLVSWKKDEEMVLEANENYWRGAPKVKRIVFRPIPETSSRVAALLSGEVDIIKDVSPEILGPLKKSPNVKITQIPGVLNIHMRMDTIHGGPLAKKKVRQALNYAIDAPALIENVLGGNAKRLASAGTPFQFGFDSSIKPYTHNPEKAKRLLAEAGYPGDKDLKLTLTTPIGRYLNDKALVEAIAGQFRKIGIDAKVRAYEFAAYMPVLKNPKGDGATLNLLGWAGNLDSDAVLYPLLHCGMLYSRYCNKELDDLLEAARSTLVIKDRIKYYNKAMKLIKEEAPWLILHHQIDTYAANKRVKGWEPSPNEPTTFWMFPARIAD
jgi:peptide/nickel transport system substrate-binding protein